MNATKTGAKGSQLRGGVNVLRILNMKLNQEGLNRFFGTLEAQIMEIVWEHGNVTIKHVQSLLHEDLSFNTVMTVLKRLTEKGHLKKTVVGKGRNQLTSFEPVQTKEQFIHEQTRMVTEELVQEYGDLVVNHLFDAVKEADPKLLDLLAARLEDWKGEKP